MNEEVIINALHDNRKKFDNISGLVGYGVGSSNSGTPSAVIFVKSKKPNNKITKMSAILPQKIDNIAVNVIEVGDIIPHGYESKVRPIQPGYSCGHQSGSTGTMGGFFKDHDNDYVILTNNHVAALENQAQINDHIIQPGIIDGGTPFNGFGNDIINCTSIGTLKKFVPLSESNNIQDSAIIKINHQLIDAGLVNFQYPNGNIIKQFGNAVVGMDVHKHGRTTGLTTGKVLAVKASFTINYGVGPISFEDCVVTSSMSKPGDSGSVIMNGSDAVALLFAGSNKVTIGNAIIHPVREYGLKIINSINPQWKIVGPLNHSFTKTTVNAKANQCAYLERIVGDCGLISAAFDATNDYGATWGPGISFRWANGPSLKCNLRHSQGFGGYCNDDCNIVPSSLKSATLRVRKDLSFGRYVAEALVNGSWIQLAAIPLVMVNGPVTIRIGKHDIKGEYNDHHDVGQDSYCIVSDIVVS